MKEGGWHWGRQSEDRLGHGSLGAVRGYTPQGDRLAHTREASATSLSPDAMDCMWQFNSSSLEAKQPWGALLWTTV